MRINSTSRRTIAIVVAFMTAAIGFGAVAGAATIKSKSKAKHAKTHKTRKASSTAGSSAETALTGEAATQAKAAAEAAVSGGTAKRATSEDPAEGTGAAYEVLVAKSDGSMVKVLLDKSFKVISTQACGGHDGDHGDHDGGHGDHDGGHGDHDGGHGDHDGDRGNDGPGDPQDSDGPYNPVLPSQPN